MANNLVIHAFDRDPIPSPAHDRDPDLDREPIPSTGGPLLPHHKLIAYGVARDLLLAVRSAAIRDAKLRDEALRSAKSACLNCAEGAGRVSRADKARAFTIARRSGRGGRRRGDRGPVRRRAAGGGPGGGAPRRPPGGAAHRPRPLAHERAQHALHAHAKGFHGGGLGLAEGAHRGGQVHRRDRLVEAVVGLDVQYRLHHHAEW